MKNKTLFSNLIYILIASALLWVAISGIIQRFKCPEMTETQILLHTPKSVMCDWKSCD